MGVYLLNIVIAGIAACIIHEGGHYLAALCFGERLKFRFGYGRLFNLITIPRWICFMPSMARNKQKVVAVAGFGMEFLVAGVAVALGWFWLLLVASCHIVAYPFYAGESSDFKWL